MKEKQWKEHILNDPILFKLSKLSQERGVPIFLVGGYLRDILLESHKTLSIPKRVDYDIVIPKENLSIIEIIEKTLGVHLFKVGKEETETLTYRAVGKGISIDITPLQGKMIEEDLKRRDFTINSMALSLFDGQFYSVEGALEDIQKRRIRSTSPTSIEQDPLRMLRAVRYLCTLEGFQLESEVREEIASKKASIQNIPSERVKAELDTILLSPSPAMGIRCLYELGLLFVLIPELKGLEGLGQNGHHHLKVLPHVFLMLEKIPYARQWVEEKGKVISLSPEDLLVLSYGALLHDLGKQDTYVQDEEGRVHFYQHESFSFERAKVILERLRFSNLMRDRILKLIQNHMRILNLSKNTKDTALKRLIHYMGKETPLLVLHTLADKEASRGLLSIEKDEVVESNCLRILDLLKEKETLSPPPFITGHDVLALGYSPGPRVGEILREIRERQIDGELKTREEALKLLREKFSPPQKEKF